MLAEVLVVSPSPQMSCAFYVGPATYSKPNFTSPIFGLMALPMPLARELR